MSVEKNRVTLTETKEGPLVSVISGKYDFEKNDNDVYSYSCPFGKLLKLVEGVQDNTDIRGTMSSFLEDNGRLELHKLKQKKGDLSGKMFSQLEASIFRTESFNYVVDPSEGTMYRWAKAGKKNMKAVFLVPKNYDENDPENKEHETYVKTVCYAAVDAGVNLDIVRCEWSDLPHGFGYFGSHGHRLHSAGYNGMGIELNPYVAMLSGHSVHDVKKVDGGYKVTYVKNGRSYTYVYRNEPGVCRIHGGEFAQHAGLYYNRTLNTFNVVSTRMIYITNKIPQGEDKYYDDHADTVMIPDYTVVQYKIGDYVHDVAVDEHNVVVDILSPTYELSYRMYLIDRMSGAKSTVVGKWKASRLGAYHFTRPQLAPECDLYTEVDTGIPSQWFFNGRKWVLRAYPEAFKARRLAPPHAKKKRKQHAAKANIFMCAGVRCERTDKGDVWVVKEGGQYWFVHESKYYDADLVFYSTYYCKNGVSTIALLKTIERGDPYVVNDKFAYSPTTNQVSMMLPCDKLSTPVRFNSRDVDVGEKSKMRVFTFASDSDRNTFYFANIHYRNKMWFGDLSRYYDFCDYSNGRKTLIPYKYHAIDVQPLDMVFSLDKMMAGVGTTNEAGNFIGDEYSDSAFFDFDAAADADFAYVREDVRRNEDPYFADVDARSG